MGNSRQSGLYISSSAGGPLRTVADTKTPIPGGPGDFSSFEDGKIDGVNVAFRAYDAVNRVGVYLSINGQLSAVSSIAVPNPQVPDS